MNLATQFTKIWTHQFTCVCSLVLVLFVFVCPVQLFSDPLFKKQTPGHHK